MSWNKKTDNNQKLPKPSKNPKANRKAYPILGLGVLILIGAAVFFCSFNKGQPQKSSVKESVPKVTKANNHRASEVVPDVKEQKLQKKLKFWEVDAAHTNGFTEVQMRKWRKEHRPPPGYTNDAALTRSRAKYAIFPHRSENQIAALLTLEPGQTMIGSFDLRNVQEDFLKSCEKPIIVNSEDTPENAALKKLMNEVKIELRERISAGEKLEDILSETQKEYQRLARCKQEIEHILHELKKEGFSSEQELDDTLNAANKMLEGKGIAPIQFGPITRQSFLRHVIQKD